MWKQWAVAADRCQCHQCPPPLPLLPPRCPRHPEIGKQRCGCMEQGPAASARSPERHALARAAFSNPAAPAELHAENRSIKLKWSIRDTQSMQHPHGQKPRESSWEVKLGMCIIWCYMMQQQACTGDQAALMSGFTQCTKLSVSWVATFKHAYRMGGNSLLNVYQDTTCSLSGCVALTTQGIYA